MRRPLAAALVLVSAVALAGGARAGEPVTLRYGAGPVELDVASETSFSIAIEGTDTAASFVRSLHPILSLESFHAKAGGRHRVSGGRHEVENDRARVRCRYDDEDHEHDFVRAAPPAALATDKLVQVLWYMTIGGRRYTLSPLGHYRTEQPDQDHNGEFMDMVLVAATRLPKGPVGAGSVSEETWRGLRSEKGKKAAFLFKQRVTIEAVEEKNGRKTATLASEITGNLVVPDNERDKNAEEAWTRCEGKTRLVLDVERGTVLASSGVGKVVAYYRSTAEDGSKNEVTVTFAVEGKTEARRRFR